MWSGDTRPPAFGSPV